MELDEMQSELTRSLEFWNQALAQEKQSFEWETKLGAMISERMKGMIELAGNIKIITDAEKSELNYIYFNEEPEPNEPTG